MNWKNPGPTTSHNLNLSRSPASGMERKRRCWAGGSDAFAPDPVDPEPGPSGNGGLAAPSTVRPGRSVVGWPLHRQCVLGEACCEPRSMRLSPSSAACWTGPVTRCGKPTPRRHILPRRRPPTSSCARHHSRRCQQTSRDLQCHPLRCVLACSCHQQALVPVCHTSTWLRGSRARGTCLGYSRLAPALGALSAGPHQEASVHGTCDSRDTGRRTSLRVRCV